MEIVVKHVFLMISLISASRIGLDKCQKSTCQTTSDTILSFTVVFLCVSIKWREIIVSPLDGFTEEQRVKEEPL